MSRVIRCDPNLAGLRFVLFIWFVSSLATSAAIPVQLLSARTPALTIPDGGNANSDLPIVSADGRYVIFASTARNLLPNPYPVAGSAFDPGAWQVFVRDRVAGTTTLVSVNLSNAPANGDSFPAAISTNGQYVLFESAASDLVNNDTNNATDIFLRDLVNHTDYLVSVSANTTSASGASYNAAMTPDARFIAFVSAANNIVPGDNNGIPDVFVRDRIAGTNSLISVSASNTASYILPSTSESPEITPDGRYVAFYSTATNLVAGVTNAGQVYVRDRIAGTTTWASLNAPILYSSLYSGSSVACNPRLSADGAHVVFQVCNASPGTTTNLGLILRFNLQAVTTDIIVNSAMVPALQLQNINSWDMLDMTPDGRFVAYVAPTNSLARCIKLWDAQSGQTTFISQNRSGTFTAGDFCNYPRLDATGRYVVFLAAATNLVTNTATGYNYYLRDTQAGATYLLSVDTNALGAGASALTPPSLNTNATVVAFVAPDGNLVPNDSNGASDVFIRNTVAGSNELISVRSAGQANLACAGLTGFSTLGVNSNGLRVAFTSDAADLVSNDTNKMRDVYVRDLVLASNLLVSVNTNGFAATGISSDPSISGDGRYVVFSSTAPDFISRDTNNCRDVFVRDLKLRTTTLVSKDIPGTGEGNGDSYSPTISADGRYVLYFSVANNLSGGTFTSGAASLYLRDLQLGTNYALTSNAGVIAAAMTPDGHRVAFVGAVNSLAAQLYVWDTLLKKRVYTNSYTTAVTGISPDGSLVAFVNTQLKIANLATTAITTPSSGTFAPRIGARFSADNRYLVYSTTAANTAADTNTTYDVFLYDLLGGTNLLISHVYNTIYSPNGTSDSPVISPDGRFIAYRSFSSNEAATDVNGTPDVLFYDRSNATTVLVSVNVSSNWNGNSRCYAPLFSADSRSLVFASTASDLVARDFNSGGVFLLPLYPSIATTNSDGSPAMVPGVQLSALSVAQHNPTLTWPVMGGGSYHIQYKDDLIDAVWHDFVGTMAVDALGASASDMAPSSTNRFYRIIFGN